MLEKKEVWKTKERENVVYSMLKTREKEKETFESYTFPLKKKLKMKIFDDVFLQLEMHGVAS